MHEASIALAVVEEICERAEREDIERITSVSLRIGVLTGVVPDALRFAWDLATDGTPAQHAALQIEHVPLRIRCKTCAAERTIERGTLPVCPICGTPSSDIIEGRELHINTMEVVYAASAGGRPAEHPSQELNARA